MLSYKDGMSDTLIRLDIMEVTKNMDITQKRTAFGSYVMVHIGTTNTTGIRRVPETTLKVSNNSGWYYFMNIFTGKLKAYLKLETIADTRGRNRTGW